MPLSGNVPSYLQLKITINTDGGSITEDYNLPFAPPISDPPLIIAGNLLKLRGYMLDAQSRIVAGVISSKQKKGSNPADGFIVPPTLFQTPVLLKEPDDVGVTETAIGDTADPALGLRVDFAVAGGGVEKRLYRCIRASWVDDNQPTFTTVPVPLAPSTADPGLAMPAIPSVLLQNFLSYYRDNCCFVTPSTDPVNVFILQAFAAGYVGPPAFGPDWQMKGCSRRRIGSGWPKKRGRKPVLA